MCCYDEYDDGPYTCYTLEDLYMERVMEKVRDTVSEYTRAVERYRDALVAAVRVCGTGPENLVIPSISRGKFVVPASSDFYAINGTSAEDVAEAESDILSMIDENSGLFELGFDALVPERFNARGEIVNKAGEDVLDDSFQDGMTDKLFQHFLAKGV